MLQMMGLPDRPAASETQWFFKILLVVTPAHISDLLRLYIQTHQILWAVPPHHLEQFIPQCQVSSVPIATIYNSFHETPQWWFHDYQSIFFSHQLPIMNDEVPHDRNFSTQCISCFSVKQCEVKHLRVWTSLLSSFFMFYTTTQVPFRVDGWA